MPLPWERVVRRVLAPGQLPGAGGSRGTASPTALGQGPRGWVAVGCRVPEGRAGHVGPGAVGALSASYLR